MRRGQASEEAGGVLPPGPEQGQVQSQEVCWGRNSKEVGGASMNPGTTREREQHRARTRSALLKHVRSL